MAKINNILNFLKEFNIIRNPVTTEIDNQIWHYNLKDLPSIKELWSIYDTDDYENLKVFYHEILKKYPQIDTERVGIAGGSYGGFMTNWITSHTNLFKAAVTQRSISNWVSFYATSDIGYYFSKDQLKLKEFN